jgi:hypothetical protein
MIPGMTTPPKFAPLAAALRDQVIEYYEQTGARLDTPSGRRTLDTNSSLAADRGRILLRLLAESGCGPVAGADPRPRDRLRRFRSTWLGPSRGGRSPGRPDARRRRCRTAHGLAVARSPPTPAASAPRRPASHRDRQQFVLHLWIVPKPNPALAGFAACCWGMGRVRD